MKSIQLHLCLLAACLPLCWADGGGPHTRPADRHDRAETATVTGVKLDRADGPRLELEVTGIDDRLLSLRLLTKNFVFSEGHAGGDRVAGEGHGQLLIDGAEAGLIFATPHPLPDLAPGTHEIAVILVANDHAPYMVGGLPVAARLVVRVTKPRPPKRRTDAAVRRLTVDIVDGAVTEKTLRVTQGDAVRIDWTSDEAAELHLHGYDIAARVAADAPVSMRFTADVAGRFPVARHASANADAHGHHALMYLEVYP